METQQGSRILPCWNDTSPANAGVRRGLFLPRKNGKGKGGKGRPSSPTGHKGKSMQDCPSNIPTIYFYGFWRDLASAELHRRKLSTKENFTVLDQHLEGVENDNTSDYEDTTLHGGNESICDCKIDCYDSAFVLANNLAPASKGKGSEDLLSSY